MTPSADWRVDLLRRVRALRAELRAINAYYSTRADEWHQENARRARDRAA